MTAYYPIAGSAGKVIGVLYVGIPMAQYEAMLAHAIQTMAIAAAVAALLVMMLTMLIVGRVTKPLTSVTASLTAIAEGNSDVEIDCSRTDGRDRRDRAHRCRVQEQLARAPQASRGNRPPPLRRRHRAAQGRIARFVDEFQTSVGGILDKVLNSSSEFERVAKQLTETARTTASLSGQSAGASETASEQCPLRGRSLR